MPAAAEEAAVGNHHVLAIKKYVLTKVISQMTTRRTRPMQRDLPSEILGQPHYGSAYNPWSHSSGAANAASLPQLTASASAFFFFWSAAVLPPLYSHNIFPQMIRRASRGSSQSTEPQLSSPKKSTKTRIDVLFHFE